MWDLPRPGLEPVSPALAGGFLTAAPPGSPRASYFWRTSLNLSISEVSSGLDSSYTFFGRNTKEIILYPSQCIISGGAWYQFAPLLVMLILITWLRSGLPSFFLCCKITIFPFLLNKYPVRRYFENMKIHRFSSDFHLLTLAFLGGSLQDFLSTVLFLVPIWFPKKDYHWNH